MAGNADPRAITAGPDNTVWFADQAGAVGYASASSTPPIEENRLSDARPYTLVYDKPNGHIWFTQSGGKLGEIDPYNHHVVSTYDIDANVSVGLFPSPIIADSAGRLWVGMTTSPVDYSPANGVAVYDPNAHTSVMYNLAGFHPIGEAFDADGNLWIAEGDPAQVEVMQTVGATVGSILRTIPLPNSSPRAITLGPDGNMWLADGMGAIWRITPMGSTQKFSLPGCEADSIAADFSRKALWFTTYNCKPLNKITTTGVVTSWASPGTGATAVAVGNNNDVWYSTEGNPPSTPPSLVRAVP